jgi:hypothetical protein
LLAGFPSPWSVFGATKPAAEKSPTAAHPVTSAAEDGYVGSEACSKCHSDIYRDFKQTRMGRSLARPTPSLLENLPTSASVFSEALDRHYEIFTKDGKLYQAESQTDSAGREVFRSSHPVDWLIGAGMNGYSALVKRGNYIFEAPLSFYAKTGKWEMSPGYEAKDLGFNRPVLAGCISCHSGRPDPADQNTGKFKPVAFTQLAIGCENCHGPGQEHVHARSIHSQAAGSGRIVNPGRLTAELDNDICMSCHEAGDSRVLKPGKTYQDFRPGTPLDETMAILMVPPKPDNPNDSDHVQHYFQMSMSKCYRASSGQLRCTTCHDPHIEPSSEEAPEYFNAKCASCHASRTCTLPAAARRQTTPADNCIGCHMLKREAAETAHTVLTEHRIVIRPDEPWPPEAFRQTTPSLPDLIHLDKIPGQSEDLPLLSLLEGYREITERKPEYAASYAKVLAELEHTEPDNATVQQALGHRDLESGEPQKAIEHLERAAQLDPQQAMTYSYLAEALGQQGAVDKAIAAGEKAVSLNPYNQLLQKALIDRLIAGKEYQKALAAMEHYLEVFPEDSFMRQMLAIAKQ